MIDVATIEQEERTALEAQVAERVLTRLYSARQSAQDKLNAAQSDLNQVESEITARTPVAPVEEPVQG